MHLVTRAHFRLRDKYSGHTIRCAIVDNTMLHANFMALCFIEPGLLTMEVYIARIGILDLCRSCDPDLDPMTFIYELDPYSLEIYRMRCANMNFSSYVKTFKSCRLTDIDTYTWTDTTKITGWPNKNRTFLKVCNSCI